MRQTGRSCQIEGDRPTDREAVEQQQQDDCNGDGHAEPRETPGTESGPAPGGPGACSGAPIWAGACFLHGLDSVG